MAEAVPNQYYVGGIPSGTTDEALAAAFATFGKVVSAKVTRGQRKRHFGHVAFAAPAPGALVADAAKIGATAVKVEKATPAAVAKPKSAVKVPKDPTAKKEKVAREPVEMVPGPANRVFVGGIAPETTKEEIVGMLAAWGAATVQATRRGWRRGYACAAFATDEEAAAAIAGWTNDAISLKPSMVAKKEKVQPEKAAAEAPSTQTEYFIGGIPAGTTDEALKAAFAGFGKVVTAGVNCREGRMRRFGYVTFAAPALDVTLRGGAAIKLGGVAVQVEVARGKTGKTSKQTEKKPSAKKGETPKKGKTVKKRSAVKAVAATPAKAPETKPKPILKKRPATQAAEEKPKKKKKA